MDAIGATVALDEVGTMGDTTGAGGATVVSHIDKAGAGGTGGGQRQQYPNGHDPQAAGGRDVQPPPPRRTSRGSHSNDARSGASRDPLAVPATDAAIGHTLCPEQGGQGGAPNRDVDPRARPAQHQIALVTGS
jgi:hypothetical protein